MMAALFGTLMVASLTEVLLSRFLHLARRIINHWYQELCDDYRPFNSSWAYFYWWWLRRY